MPDTSYLSLDFLKESFSASSPGGVALPSRMQTANGINTDALIQHTPLVLPNGGALRSTPVSTAPGSEQEVMHTPTEFEGWLPFAAKAYKISPDIKDYIFRPVIIFVTDLPNRNGVGFPARELARWNVEAGCQAYKAWRGKPMHIEHQSDDHTAAIGVIVDVSMVPLRGFGQNKLWKVIALAALDRTKNERVKRIEKGELNTYSMGAMVQTYHCSYCGLEVGDGRGMCEHIDPEEKVVLYELNGKLVYRLVYDIFPYELSSVDDPAYAVAVADYDQIRYNFG